MSAGLIYELAAQAGVGLLGIALGLGLLHVKWWWDDRRAKQTTRGNNGRNE